MPSLAARWAGWERRRGAALASPMGASFPGVPFIPELPSGKLSVEVAWGADLNGDPDVWSWVDVTRDVRANPGITTRLGRNDEGSETSPAEMTVVLDNTRGDYANTGLSVRWPYVRRNTPVRVQVDPGSGPRVLWQGSATGWSPGWDALTGRIPVVTLSASGVLRRLAQGTDPIISPLTRNFTALANVVDYWSMEGGAHAADFPATIGSSALTWGTVAPDLDGTDIADSTAPLPTLGTAVLASALDGYTSVQSDGSVTIQAMMGFPATPVASTFSQVIKVFMTGGTAGSFVLYVSNSDSGDLGVRAFAGGGALLGDTGEQGFEVNGAVGLHGFRLYQSGGSVFASIRQQTVGGGSAFTVDVSLFVGTLGAVTAIQVNPFGENPNLVFGQLSVVADNPSFFASPVNAYNGRETVTARLARLCSENDIEFDLIAGTVDTATFADVPGSQNIDTVLKLLRACEDQERGILWDGISAGLTYTNRRYIEDGSARFTIDAAAGELTPPFAPVDDDQNTRNRWTVERDGGAQYTVEDVTGPLGTAVVGDYGDSLTVNSYADQAARDIADWLVHTGTIEGYRYPALTIDLRAVPRLAPFVTDLRLGDRVDIANLGTALSTATPDTVSVVVQGISHAIGPDQWIVTLNCSPFQVWKVATLAATTGDVGEFVEVFDTDGATVDTTALTGATSLTVATTSGPLWTTDADDFPLLLDVGGVKVRATACSGASSPQTFTVDALTANRPAGLSVAVWLPNVLGL